MVMIAVSPVCLHVVTVFASSPSYFRGFTLIALKEGTEGDKEEDYAGNFQVRKWIQIYIILRA